MPSQLSSASIRSKLMSSDSAAVAVVLSEEEIFASTTIEYRTIPGYGNYLAGSDGTIWSLLRYNVGKQKGTPRLDAMGRSIWRKLQPIRKKAKEYLQINLLSGGRGSGKAFPLHVLIGRTFLGPTPLGMEICHDDGDPENNRATNLRHDTHQGNMSDKYRHGTIGVGENASRHKYSQAQIDAVRQMLASGSSCREAGEANGVNVHTVFRVRRNEHWKI